MSSLKEEWMESQQEQVDREHAKKLGLTYDEFCEMDLHSIDDSDNNGTLVFQFTKESPAHLLKKIGADEMGAVRVSAI